MAPKTRTGIEHEELKGFTRTVAEIEWLLAILVLLYQVVRGDPANAAPVLIALALFAGFVMGFHYVNFSRRQTRWKLAIETWVMIVFITWILWHSGKLDSPLLNLYTLVVITSALTLGKAITLLEVVLISACYFLLGYGGDQALMPLGHVTDVVVLVAPMLLVAYITTMLSSDIRSALTRIKTLSETDELTGLYNLRAFTTITERAFLQAKRYSRPLSILMIDSDNLKTVNDSFGHEAGNRLLKLTVQCIQEALRATDVVARYGGDEFIALLPDTPAAGAMEVAERIRVAVAHSPLDVRGESAKTSVSIGIATYPDHGGELSSILNKADQAMYLSKKQGRNRVTLIPAD
ncbi:MAG TPA: GGDEF domain-containing protein [Burkholderiales bacterium]|nr:GGDEF domain-containing protein [Burkholderiales bacterium]